MNIRPRRGQRVELAYTLVAAVGQRQKTARRNRNRARRIQASRHRRRAIPGESLSPLPRNGRNRARSRDPPHTLVSAVRNVDISRTIDRQPARKSQARTASRSAIATERLPTPNPRHGRDDPRRRAHLAHTPVMRVRNKQVARSIQRQSIRRIDRRCRRNPAIARESLDTIARHRRNHARARSYPAYAMITRVRHIHVARNINRKRR